MAIKKRIDWIDIAKGAAIILMIIGHIPGLNQYIRGVIFSFHMPLFMMVNGYLIHNYDIKKTFTRSCRTLLLPYFIVCILLTLIAVFTAGSLQEAGMQLLRKSLDMLLGFSKPPELFSNFGIVTIVWFLPCLFLARNIYIVAMSLLSGAPVWVRWGSVILLSAAGQALGSFGIYLPWSLDVALFSVIFIACGDLMHKKELPEKGKWPLMVFPPLIWVGLLLTKTHIELATRNYPLIVVGTICAIAGSITFMQLSRFTEKKLPPVTRILTWYGRNSLVILAVHTLEVKLYNWNDFSIPGIGQTVNVLIMLLLRLAIITLCTLIFERLMTFVKSKKKKTGEQNAPPEG